MVEKIASGLGGTKQKLCGSKDGTIKCCANASSGAVSLFSTIEEVSIPGRRMKMIPYHHPELFVTNEHRNPWQQLTTAREAISTESFVVKEDDGNTTVLKFSSGSGTGSLPHLKYHPLNNSQCILEKTNLSVILGIYRLYTRYSKGSQGRLIPQAFIVLLMLLLTSLTMQVVNGEENNALSSHRSGGGVNSASPCPVSEHTCDNLQCVPRDKVCNGFNDCGDNSDEHPGCTRK